MSCEPEVVLSVRGVSKRFEMYAKPAHRLLQLLLGRFGKRFYKEFWALRDVSFDVRRGECVGIVGRNGAGKSTLLQIVAGTLAPTSGTVESRGRVAALLELGSGFNPEFTGRENVYLNGSILGLSRREIDARYGEIAAFADIGEFIDRPVKSYSSGMMVRLAFAVQVMVDPDVLIVDEALAVGDARFQLKCFDRLRRLRERGTSVLFVSHAIDQVRSLCDRAVLLERGKALYVGTAKEAALRYMQQMFPKEAVADTDAAQAESSGAGDGVSSSGALAVERDGSLSCAPDVSSAKTFGVGGARIEKIRIVGIRPPGTFAGGEAVSVDVRYGWDRAIVQRLAEEKGLRPDIGMGVALADAKGSYVFGMNSFDAATPVDCRGATSATVRFSFRMPKVSKGTHFLTFAIALGEQANHVQVCWYDYLVSLESLPDGRGVFGQVAVDYDFKILEKGGNPSDGSNE